MNNWAAGAKLKHTEYPMGCWQYITATNVYITEFYNQRGDSERNFDILNNDFNCNRLPFSFLNANVVYLFAAAICFTLFEWIKRIFFDKDAKNSYSIL